MRWSLALGTLASLARNEVAAADSFYSPDERSLQPAPPNTVANLLVQGSQFTRLVYNRVPKTGSTTMKELFERLANLVSLAVHTYEKHHQLSRGLHAVCSATVCNTTVGQQLMKNLELSQASPLEPPLAFGYS